MMKKQTTYCLAAKTSFLSTHRFRVISYIPSGRNTVDPTYIPCRIGVLPKGARRGNAINPIVSIRIGRSSRKQGLNVIQRRATIEHVIIATTHQGLSGQIRGGRQGCTTSEHVTIAISRQGRSGQHRGGRQGCATIEHVSIAISLQRRSVQRRGSRQGCTTSEHVLIAIILQCRSR